MLIVIYKLEPFPSVLFSCSSNTPLMQVVHDSVCSIALKVNLPTIVQTKPLLVFFGSDKTISMLSTPDPETGASGVATTFVSDILNGNQIEGMNVTRVAF